MATLVRDKNVFGATKPRNKKSNRQLLPGKSKGGYKATAGTITVLFGGRLLSL